MVNRIPEICKMLGVEVGEEFKIRDEICEDKEVFFIDERGALLIVHTENGKRSFLRPIGISLEDLLSGHSEIVKLPFKPKEGEWYYTFGGSLMSEKVWIAMGTQWKGSAFDIAMMDKGWVFRTKEEAEVALQKTAEELGVEYEFVV